MLQYQLPMGFGDADHRRWGGDNQQSYWECWSTLAGIRKYIFTKIEAYSGMAERLVRDLAIEEALQDEIKHTLENNNQSYGDWYDTSYKEKQQQQC